MMATTPALEWDKSLSNVSIVFRRVVRRARLRTIKDGSSVSHSAPTLVGNFTNVFTKDNLRFAVNACIFGAANTTDSISTPCSSSTVCEPLEAALGDGMQTPLKTDQYSYCSANDSSFLGSNLGTCQGCLKLNGDTFYLSNCIALPIFDFGNVD